MASIEFHARIGTDQIIRPPAGVALPEGPVEVWVRSTADSASEAPSSDALASTRDWLLDLAALADRANPELPPDLAERHDHYAHGKPS